MDIGVWCNGSIDGSNPSNVGSIPAAPAIDAPVVKLVATSHLRCGEQ